MDGIAKRTCAVSLSIGAASCAAAGTVLAEDALTSKEQTLQARRRLPLRSWQECWTLLTSRS
jgi:hypothetical protein